MALEIYRGLRVLVTGHTGFKGAWLSHWLLDLGAEVSGFSLSPPTRPSLFEVLGLGKRLRHRLGDVRDFKDLASALAGARPQLVFHLAAQPLVRKSYDAPKETFDVNLGGVVNLLEAVRRRPSVRAVVVCTSDKCYENSGSLWGYRECDPLGGKDPYSASKAAAELAARSYAVSFFGARGGPRVATVRAGNVIGGGDWARDRVVPDCVRAWEAGRPALLRHPRSVRPWQHVLEPLAGYLSLGEGLLRGRPGLAGEAFNFGPPPGVDRPVAGLVEQLRRSWPRGAWRRAPARGGRPEAARLRLNSDKALALLGWSGVLDFEEAVGLTADWYRAHAGKTEDMRAFTTRQAAFYLSKTGL